MATTSRKVKKSATKRFRVTLEKIVTMRLTTVVELDVPNYAKGVTVRGPDGHLRNTALAEAVNGKLAVERCNDIEREWSTESVNDRNSHKIRWASIQEIDPHISVTSEEKDTVKA